MRRSSNVIVAAATAAAIAAPAAALAADPAELLAPQLRTGDSWVFAHTVERGPSGFNQQINDLRVESVDSDDMVVGLKPDGSPASFEDHVVGLDWSERQNIDGKDVVTVRPFQFPLAIGRTWTAEYVDPVRHGNQLSAAFHVTYKAVGWEDVTTPAGVFRALKIEGVKHVDGHMAASTTAATAAAAAPGSATSAAQVSHLPDRIVHETWRLQIYYVPELKFYAKLVVDHYNAQETRVLRESDELRSYKVQP